MRKLMKENCYIKILPDYDVLYMDSEGCCFCASGDEIYNDDLELGPRFSFVVPGIEEWLRRYENATDFTKATTDPFFDWKLWHYEGLCFAKAIKEQLPQCYSLYYEPPFEDVSNTISKMEIDECVDEHIRKLRKEVCGRIVIPAFTNHIEFEVQREGEQVEVLFKTNNMQTEVNIPFKEIPNVKKWLKRIMTGTDSPTCLCIPCWNFYFFRQTIGSHLGMGQIWILESFAHAPSFQAYVKTKNFVEELYSALMAKLEMDSSNQVDSMQLLEGC